MRKKVSVKGQVRKLVDVLKEAEGIAEADAKEQAALNCSCHSIISLCT